MKEKQEGVEGLVLRAGADVATDRQVGEEHSDLRAAHGVRVPQAMETDEANCPLHVAAFRPRRIVPHAQRPPQPVKQARGLGKRQLAYVNVEYIPVEKIERLPSLLNRPERIFFALGKVFKESAEVA